MNFFISCIGMSGCKQITLDDLSSEQRLQIGSLVQNVFESTPLLMRLEDGYCVTVESGGIWGCRSDLDLSKSSNAIHSIAIHFDQAQEGLAFRFSAGAYREKLAQFSLAELNDACKLRRVEFDVKSVPNSVEKDFRLDRVVLVNAKVTSSIKYSSHKLIVRPLLRVGIDTSDDRVQLLPVNSLVESKIQRFFDILQEFVDQSELCNSEV